MLVVDNNTYTKFWKSGDKVNPMRYAGDVVISIDPSKTNMALVVGTPDGDILSCLEFSGNNRRKGPVMDTSQYCKEVREFLSIYLSKANIYMVGVEQAIGKEGFEHYKSSMVLTEIRANILNFFLEVYQIKVIEINNWSWKFAVLPEGYRSKYEKGSKKWFVNTMPNSPYSKYFEADITDCICIYWYMVSKMCSGYSVYCNKSEPCDIPFYYYYQPCSLDILHGREVTFNPRFTIEENLHFYVNRIMKLFYMSVIVDTLDIPDMYGKSVGFAWDDLSADKVRVVAKRTS